MVRTRVANDGKDCRKSVRHASVIVLRYVFSVLGGSALFLLLLVQDKLMPHRHRCFSDGRPLTQEGPERMEVIKVSRSKATCFTSASSATCATCASQMMLMPNTALNLKPGGTRRTLRGGLREVQSTTPKDIFSLDTKHGNGVNTPCW